MLITSIVIATLATIVCGIAVGMILTTKKFLLGFIMLLLSVVNALNVANQSAKYGALEKQNEIIDNGIKVGLVEYNKQGELIASDNVHILILGSISKKLEKE